MKAIIFDIDWVVIISENEKNEIIKNVLIKHNLFNIPWVKEILQLWLNRKLLLNKIYELNSFEKEQVLKDLNNEISNLENNITLNTHVINFIKNNYKKYIFCTNTSMPIESLKLILSRIWILEYFESLYAYESWTKLENVNHVLNKYNLVSKEVLFIDDNINHINNVKPTGVHLLHFNDSNIDIEDRLSNI